MSCSLSRQFGAGECSSRSCPCCVQMLFSLTGVLNPCLGIKGLLPFMGLCQYVLPHSLFRKISLQPSGKNSDERLKNFSAAASCFVYFSPQSAGSGLLSAGLDLSNVQFKCILPGSFVDTLHCCSSSGELKVKLEKSTNVFQVNLGTNREEFTYAEPKQSIAFSDSNPNSPALE